MLEKLGELLEMATDGAVVAEANPWHRKDGTFGVDPGGEGVWSFAFKGPDKQRYWSKASKKIGRDGAPTRYETDKDGKVKKGPDGKPEKFEGRVRNKKIGDNCGRGGEGHCFKHGPDEYKKGEGQTDRKRGFRDTIYQDDKNGRGGDVVRRKSKNEMGIEKGHGVKARDLSPSDWAKIAGSSGRKSKRSKSQQTA